MPLGAKALRDASKAPEVRVLITGANGFIGRALVAELVARNLTVRGTVRNSGVITHCEDCAVIGKVNGNTDWRDALVGVTHVVHLAARAHVTHETVADSPAVFRAINTEGTLNLARQASEAGVARFIFVSTAKVHGEGREFAYSITDEPAPEDSYAISKWEAELGLRGIAAHTTMEMVILRSPLVYGQGVKANFRSMMRCLALGVPLPLAAATENRRSLVALDNLIDLIATCLNHPAAANETFLVSDGQDLSTAELLRKMGVALGHPARLFYVPTLLLKLGASVVNKTGIYQRLCGSFQLDIAKSRQLLGWIPPVSVDEGLQRAVEGFCE